LERLNVYQLLDQLHRDPNNASLYSTASQVWNLDFFLQGLTPNPVEPSDKVIEAIEGSFGSMDKFKSQFALHADSLVGSGWVWLVRKASELKIACTFNTGSPLHDAVVPATFTNSSPPIPSPNSVQTGRIRSQPSPPPQSATAASMFNSFSFAKPSASNPMPTLISNAINPMIKSSDVPAGGAVEHMPITSKIPDGSATTPIIGLNVWEHAYLLDYGLDKKQYVDRFWEGVNWNRVAILLGVY